ncbi:MAG: type VI secretion system tube protein Hcp [Gemmatimonadales bacterium]|nr:MAG: type VI secretion system tube protein Hcp [Gemmatimonadales bacterium]
MAFDAFLKIEGVEGESTRKGFEKMIEIESFSFGARNPTSIGSGGGGGAGKVSLSNFNVTKKSDAASPALFQACCSGKHFPKAEITLHKAGGEEALPYLTYSFEKVFIESIDWGGAGGSDDRPSEQVSLAFGKVEILYQPQSETGAAAGAVSASWDQMAVSR